jgi:hypothetical protein
MRFLRGLAGRVLPCGCLVGVYETYSGGVVATIDARGPACTEANHRLHEAVQLSQPGVMPPGVLDHAGPATRM